MRCLGIDYGNKHIGIAVSDDDGNFAFPRIVLDNDIKKVLFFLRDIIEKEKIGTVVLGLPFNFSGEDTVQTKKVRDFGELIKKELPADIIFQNEILSTKEAQKSGGSTKEMIDASSAALILQSFLDNKR